MVFAILALVAVASAALPVSVTATLTHPNPYLSTSPYWIVDITAGGNADLPNGIYDGYCGDGSVVMKQMTTFNIYDSRVPALFPSGLTSADWNRINYVLNNKQGANKETLQVVYWHYGGVGYIPNANYDLAKYNEIIADANAYGGSYVPTTAGQIYAVITWNPNQVQSAFIEAVVPTTPGPNPVPEFPSLALPIAMMLGLVFIVHVVKGREK
jgi:hypothetical protein